MRKLQGSTPKSASAPQTVPPQVEKRCAETSLHGVTFSDDYNWLKAENWQEVLRDPAALPGDIRAVLEADGVERQFWHVEKYPLVASPVRFGRMF